MKLTYQEKAKILKENGWETWYSNDNWIKTEWVEQGKKIDMAGRSTDDAYASHIGKINHQRDLFDQVMQKANIKSTHIELSDEIIAEVAKANYMSVKDITKILNFDS